MNTVIVDVHRNQLAVDYGLGKTLTASAKSLIDQWMRSNDFAGLVGKVRLLVSELRAQLTDAGYSEELVDAEVEARVLEWALVGGLISAPEPPPAKSSTSKPSVRRLWAEQE